MNPDNFLSTEVEQKPFRLIAHRALGFGERENSLAALKRALSSSSDEIEIDVRISKDRKLVVCHDPLYRNNRGQWRVVSRQSLAEARKGGLMSLQTALRVFKRSKSTQRLAIEIKTAGEEEQILKMIRSHGLEKRVVVISWLESVLLRVHQLSPTMPLSYSFSPWVYSWGYVPLCPSPRLPRLLEGEVVPLESVNLLPLLFPVTRRLVRRLRSFGLRVYVVNADSFKEVAHLMAIGVSGTLTNEAGLLSRDIANKSVA